MLSAKPRVVRVVVGVMLSLWRMTGRLTPLWPKNWVSMCVCVCVCVCVCLCVCVLTPSNGSTDPSVVEELGECVWLCVCGCVCLVFSQREPSSVM